MVTVTCRTVQNPEMEANPENEEQQQSNAATRSEQSPRTFNYEEFQDLVLRSALGGELRTCGFYSVP